jgi:hypothetical protein
MKVISLIILEKEMANVKVFADKQIKSQIDR